MSSGEQQHVSPPGCEGNAAPYVLGALTEEEHSAFRIHLASCAVCREEVAALQVVADALPAAAPRLSVPGGVKRRVMATVGEDSAASRTDRRQGASWREAFSWRPALGMATAAAVIAVVAIVIFSGSGSSNSTRLIRAQVTVPKASVSLRLSGGHAELDIAGMPQTAPNRVYEVWVKRAGAPQPTNALFTVTAKGNATVGVPGSVTGVKQVLVTSEPLGGSRVPTRAPVIVASLS